MWWISLSKKTNIHILSNKTDGNSVTNAPWLTLGCNGPERGMALPRLLKSFQIPDIWPGVCHMPIWLLGMIGRPDTSSPVQVASISCCRSRRDDCLLSRNEYINVLSSWVEETLNLWLLTFSLSRPTGWRWNISQLAYMPANSSHWQTQTGSSTRYSGRSEINRSELHPNTILE